ncbi:MAG: recombinase family protein [Acidobacteriia bacterium]|nr:recombinase family protein [Terriglobia bacterium]
MNKQKRCAAYVRVSTAAQDTSSQEGELREYAGRRGWKVQIYCDTMSGAEESRPALNRLMQDARAGRIDAVIVWRFDRFGRSLRHLVSALEEFKRLNVHFISATEGVDTTLASGELVFQIFASIAQFERALICERVRAGLAAARRKGTRLGRRPGRILSESEIKKIRTARRRGTTLRKLALQFKAPLTAVYRATME